LSLEGFYQEKQPDYFANVRSEVVSSIPPGQHRVLEVGCGDGATGATLKHQSRASEVVGVEISEAAAAVAEARLDRVFAGNIEALELPYPDGYFDFLILADVLEHLMDPWAALQRVGAFLSSGGAVIASIPNVRNWRVILPLVARGRWDYAESGLLDRTHLRFFTRSTIVALFSDAGFPDVQLQRLGHKSRFASRVLVGPLRDYATPQYLVVARRATPQS
jgi:SAM-dependent methyltransferase